MICSVSTSSLKISKPAPPEALATCSTEAICALENPVSITQSLTPAARSIRRVRSSTPGVSRRDQYSIGFGMRLEIENGSAPPTYGEPDLRVELRHEVRNRGG